MTWGAAIMAMIRPALLVGPLLGLVGAVVLAGIGSATSGFEGAFFILLYAAVIGVVLGLIVATPLALVFGSILLHVASANEQWSRRWVWALLGLVVGAVAGGLIGMLDGDMATMAVVAGICGALGALGGFVARVLLRDRVAAFYEVDADIFA